MKNKVLGIITAIIVPIIVTVIADKLTKIDIIDHIILFLKSAIALATSAVSIPIWIPILLLLFSATMLYLAREDIFNKISLNKTNLIIKTEPRNIETLLAGSEIPDEIKLDLLGYQNDGPIAAYQKGLCRRGYEPGTFTLAEITPDATFLKEKISYENWIDEVLDQDLSLIKTRYPRLFKNKSVTAVKAGVKKILNSRTSFGKSLRHEVWFQEYSDIIRRIILFLLGFDLDFELELYPNLTITRKKLTFSVMEWIEDNKKPELRDWLYVSIAAGLMGVDEKTSHAATSEINKKHVIPLEKGIGDDSENIQRIGELLWKRAHTATRIDASEAFYHSLNYSTGRRFRILSFTDDYIETIFLLKYYECLLDKYPHIEINCVPRSIRCSNDATVKDVEELLQYFPGLKTNSRFITHKNGPKLGTVNLLKLHHSIYDLLESADIVDSRGARNYEMMQGINKETYFGFMVCRDFSESVIGMFSENAPLVYMKQPLGEISFKGFRNRGERKEDGHLLCSVTACDNKEKWEGGCVANMSQWEDNRRNKYEVVQSFYSKSAISFHRKYGDHLEIEVKDFLDKMYGRILVVGCGSGKEVNYLTERGCDVYGIDYSDEAIHLARNLYPDLWNRFYIEDMYNTHLFKDGQFDGIVANAALVHLLERSDLKVILQRIKQRLNIGGLGFIRVLEKGELREEYDHHLFDTVRWFVYYEMDDLTKVCNELDLFITKKLRIPHVQFPNIYWNSILFKK